MKRPLCGAGDTVPGRRSPKRLHRPRTAAVQRWPGLGQVLGVFDAFEANIPRLQHISLRRLPQGIKMNLFQL